MEVTRREILVYDSTNVCDNSHSQHPLSETINDNSDVNQTLCD